MLIATTIWRYKGLNTHATAYRITYTSQLDRIEFYWRNWIWDSSNFLYNTWRMIICTAQYKKKSTPCISMRRGWQLLINHRLLNPLCLQMVPTHWTPSLDLAATWHQEQVLVPPHWPQDPAVACHLLLVNRMMLKTARWVCAAMCGDNFLPNFEDCWLPKIIIKQLTS
jgi:hypothetical protein